MVKHTRERQEEIREILIELATSGESVATFARRLGVSTWTLYDWRRRYGASGRPVSNRRSGRRESSAARPSFVAVRLRDPSPAHLGFEITIGSVKIAVPAGFDDYELTRLIRVVSSC